MYEDSLVIDYPYNFNLLAYRPRKLIPILSSNSKANEANNDSIPY